MKPLVLAAAMLLSTDTAAHTQTADDQIHTLINSQTEAWNRNDAAAWARDFLDDASFINVRGDAFKGRVAIEKVHAFIFSGPYKGTHYAVTFDGISYPAPEIAVVDTVAEVTNFHSLPPGLAPTAPGVVRTRFRFILVKRDGAWKIFAAQNTAIAPQPLGMK